MIPTFALERTQEILYLLRQLSLKGVLKGVPVYLDAPLAINVTKTFLNYPKLFSKEIEDLITKNENPFDFEELQNGSQSFRWEKIKTLPENDLSFPIDKFVLKKLKEHFSEKKDN